MTDTRIHRPSRPALETLARDVFARARRRHAARQAAHRLRMLDGHCSATSGSTGPTSSP